MSLLADWKPVTLSGIRWWDRGLFTLTFDERPSFKAGQFCTLAMEIDGHVVKRAYSVASAPGEPLELFVVEVEGGQLSPRLARLEPGDRVWLRPKLAGLFTLDRVPQGGTLWLVATGTGLAPYVAMLREGACFDRHAHVVVVHGVRTAGQLAYAEELSELAARRPFTYVPVLSRETVPGALTGRTTSVLLDGSLEAAAGRAITPDDAHVLLCGNPEMIDEMEARLVERGLALHTPSVPGQIHLERYW